MRLSTLAAALVAAALLAAPTGAPPRAEPAAPQAGATALDALLARFRAIPGLSAHFREEKRIALLEKPIVNEGTIHYAPPGRLARHTLAPTISSVLLEGGTLRFGDGSSEQRIDLGASPVVRAFVDGFLDLLAGDRAAIEKAFTIEMKLGTGDRWEVVLHPKSAQLAGIIKEMAFAGDGVVVAKMRILEASGDEAITTFSDVDAKHAYTPAEAQQVFRLPKK